MKNMKNTNRMIVLRKKNWKQTKKLERLEKKADRILDFLETHEERLRKSEEIIKSNITDNESGKIK